jgi:hypothetical protein
MGYFNDDILKNNKQKKKKKQEQLYFMDKFQLKSQFRENTTKDGSQLYHILTNVFGNECKFGVTKVYWSNFHKPTYIAFKLPNTLPIYNKKIINVFIYLKCNVCENMHVDVTFPT